VRRVTLIPGFHIKLRVHPGGPNIGRPSRSCHEHICIGPLRHIGLRLGSSQVQLRGTPR